MKTNKLFILLIKLFFFGLMLFLIVNYSGFLLKKRTSGDITWETFYKQKKKTVDMLFFGNSHLGNGLDLNIVNAKTNAKVYNIYSSGQTLSQTYYNVKEALNYQSPKLILIESYSISGDKIFFLEDKPVNVDSVPFYSKIQSFDPKKLGIVKYEEFKDLYREEEIIPTLFPFIRNHTEWSKPEKVKENILKRNSKSESKYYFGSSNTIWNLSEESSKEYKNKNFEKYKFRVSQSQENYFEKIVDLAQENDIKILVLTIPFFKEYRNRIDYSSMNKAINGLVNKHKIEYLDLNEVYPDLDYHYFANDKVGHNQHLNYKGAIKVSNYLADFINKKFNFNFTNSNKGLPESYIYNENIKDTLLDGTKIIGNLEKLNGTPSNSIIVSQTKNHIALYGWMALENKDTSGNEMFIGLFNDDHLFSYITKPEQLKHVNRNDVSKYFKEEFIYDKSGFKYIIKSELLEKGNYKIYFVIRDKKGDIAFKNTHKKIEIR